MDVLISSSFVPKRNGMHEMCVFYWKMNVIKRDMMVPGDEIICELPKIYAILLTTQTKCATAWQCSRGFLPYLQRKDWTSIHQVASWSMKVSVQSDHTLTMVNAIIIFIKLLWRGTHRFHQNEDFFFDQHNFSSCTKWLGRFFISIKHRFSITEPGWYQNGFASVILMH